MYTRKKYLQLPLLVGLGLAMLSLWVGAAPATVTGVEGVVGSWSVAFGNDFPIRIAGTGYTQYCRYCWGTHEAYCDDYESPGCYGNTVLVAECTASPEGSTYSGSEACYGTCGIVHDAECI